MKIILAMEAQEGDIRIIVDKIEEMKYKKVGRDYIGESESKAFREVLKYKSFGNAFAGRELSLKMQDGTIETIKNNWYDAGSGDSKKYRNIGIGTLKKMQNCFVFCSININRIVLEEMLEEYLKKEKMYTKYDEVREWIERQYIWYNVIIRNKKTPFQVNVEGQFVRKKTKEKIFPRETFIKRNNDKEYVTEVFKIKYKEKGKLIKIEENWKRVIKDSIPNHLQDEVLKVKTRCTVRK